MQANLFLAIIDHSSQRITVYPKNLVNNVVICTFAASNDGTERGIHFKTTANDAAVLSSPQG